MFEIVVFPDRNIYVLEELDYRFKATCITEKLDSRILTAHELAEEYVTGFTKDEIQLIVSKMGSRLFLELLPTLIYKRAYWTTEYDDIPETEGLLEGDLVVKHFNIGIVTSISDGFVTVLDIFTGEVITEEYDWWFINIQATLPKEDALELTDGYLEFIYKDSFKMIGSDKEEFLEKAHKALEELFIRSTILKGNLSRNVLELGWFLS